MTAEVGFTVIVASLGIAFSQHQCDISNSNNNTRNSDDSSSGSTIADRNDESNNVSSNDGNSNHNMTATATATVAATTIMPRHWGKNSVGQRRKARRGQRVRLRPTPVLRPRQRQGHWLAVLLDELATKRKKTSDHLGVTKQGQRWQQHWWTPLERLVELQHQSLGF